MNLTIVEATDPTVEKLDLQDPNDDLYNLWLQIPPAIFADFWAAAGAAADGAVRRIYISYESSEKDTGPIFEIIELELSESTMPRHAETHPVVTELREWQKRALRQLTRVFYALIAVGVLLFAWDLIRAAWKFILGGS